MSTHNKKSFVWNIQYQSQLEVRTQYCDKKKKSTAQIGKVLRISGVEEVDGASTLYVIYIALARASYFA